MAKGQKRKTREAKKPKASPKKIAGPATIFTDRSEPPKKKVPSASDH